MQLSFLHVCKQTLLNDILMLNLLLHHAPPSPPSVNLLLYINQLCQNMISSDKTLLPLANFVLKEFILNKLLRTATTFSTLNLNSVTEYSCHTRCQLDQASYKNYKIKEIRNINRQYWYKMHQLFFPQCLRSDLVPLVCLKTPSLLFQWHLLLDTGIYHYFLVCSNACEQALVHCGMEKQCQ